MSFYAPLVSKHFFKIIFLLLWYHSNYFCWGIHGSSCGRPLYSSLVDACILSIVQPFIMDMYPNIYWITLLFDKDSYTFL